MTNEELLYLLTKYQNPHYKYKMRMKKPFIFFVKNKNFPRKVIYVRYNDDNTVLSTGETDLKKAEKFALEHLENHTKEGIKAKKQSDEFHKYLLEYYAENSIHIDYCNQHNRKVSDRDRKSYESMMKSICLHTTDIRKFKQLDKQRLVKLQSDYLAEGKSVKTIKNYFTAFERTYKELLDKDIIEHNPFQDLPALKIEISQAWDCFPIKPFKHRLPLLPMPLENEDDFLYALLGFIAIMTGQREGEIELLTSKSIIKTKENNETRFWLEIDGTKTKNANRIIPITKLTAYAIKCFCELKTHKNIRFLKSKDYNQYCLLYFGQFCGYDSLEKIKNCNDGKSKIVFHGFRKMYKTFLTQENVNKDLIEFCLGHKSKMAILRNSHSNLNDTYLVLEKSDNLTAHKAITTALSYFEPIESQKEKTERFLSAFALAAEYGLTITDCYNFAQKTSDEEMFKAYGNLIWQEPESPEKKQLRKEQFQKAIKNS